MCLRSSEFFQRCAISLRVAVLTLGGVWVSVGCGWHKQEVEFRLYNDSPTLAREIRVLGPCDILDSEELLAGSSTNLQITLTGGVNVVRVRWKISDQEYEDVVSVVCEDSLKGVYASLTGDGKVRLRAVKSVAPFLPETVVFNGIVIELLPSPGVPKEPVVTAQGPVA